MGLLGDSISVSLGMVTHTCISGTRIQRQEDHKFQITLAYTERPCLRKIKQEVDVLLLVCYTGVKADRRQQVAPVSGVSLGVSCILARFESSTR